MKIKNIVPISIAAIFILLFIFLSLDSLAGQKPLIGILIENIPTLILVIVLAISIRKQKLGGLLFLIVALGFTLFFKTYQRIDTFLLITCPLVLIGSLFLLSKNENTHNI